MPSPRRFLALLLATLLVGALLAVVPSPAIAIERGTRLDTVVPDLEPLDASPPGSDEAAAAGEDGPEPRLFASDEDVDDFELIGATFASDDVEDGRIRVLVDGEWSPWEPLTNMTGDHGPDPDSPEGRQAKPASDPIWVGDGEGYELDLPADATDVAVHVVRETEERVVVDATEEAGAYQMPKVRPRSAWGARKPSHSIGKANKVTRAIIHHTVNSNGYSKGAVPGMIRSIQQYHMGAQGWWDIGYNFIVDRFGRRWEGRLRSTYQPIIGAHAKDSNTGSTGIAYLGNGSGVPMTTAAHEATARLIAWKLPLHGTFFGRSGGAVVGHRDVFSTSCPGNAIHGQLASIQRRAHRLRPPKGPFLDVADKDWNGPDIRWGKNEGLATGWRDGNFRPGASLTRTQFVAMMWQLSGKPTVENQPHGFRDVPRGNLLQDALDWAAAEGIITGFPDNTFRGSRAIDRDTLIVQVHRWAGQPSAPRAAGYGDVGPAHWAVDAVDWGDWFGAITGYPNNTFRPNRNVTRGQTIPILRDIRPFQDTRGTWYFDGATWAHYHEIAGGYANDTFRGHLDVNRGQGVNMLWAMMDRPEGAPDHSWPDAPPSAFYDKALDWATDEGIVEGDDGGPEFNADGSLSRADVVRWIWRAAGSPAATTDHGFSDVPPGAPYEDALDWAAEHEVMTGFEDGTFHPDDTVTRTQWVMALYRLAADADAWVGGAAPPSTVTF